MEVIRYARGECGNLAACRTENGLRNAAALGFCCRSHLAGTKSLCHRTPRSGRTTDDPEVIQSDERRYSRTFHRANDPLVVFCLSFLIY